MSTDARLAAELARRAGELLLELRTSSGLAGRELGDRGDHDANDLILAGLATARPADAVLSEESVDSAARLTADRVWIVDPLDGTREYCLPGRTDWAVHVALWQRAADGADTDFGGITDAAVALPALGTVLASDDVAPLTEQSAPGRPLRVVVSDSRPPAFAAGVAEDLGAELVPMGSAGAKAMAVVRGQADAYLHAGGQWEWDSAAPVGVALARGLHASRIDGSPLRYNEPHPYLPDLVICRADLADAVLAGVATRM